MIRNGRTYTLSTIKNLFARQAKRYEQISAKRSSDWAKASNRMEQLEYCLRRRLEAAKAAKIELPLPRGIVLRVAIEEDRKRKVCRCITLDGTVRIMRPGHPTLLTVRRARREKVAA